MNPKTLKLANIWANRRYEQNGEIFYAFSEQALAVFAKELAKVCAQSCEDNFVAAVGTAASAHNSGVAKCQQTIKDIFDH